MITKKVLFFFLCSTASVIHLRAGQEVQQSVQQMCINAFIIQMNASDDVIIRHLNTIITSTNSGKSIESFLLGEILDIDICSEYKNLLIHFKATYTVEKLEFLLSRASEIS
ncbi:hypothetical protein COB28_04670 [Candidatus Dependentiae bacterium]|nr:MAG: hypothetical protein COB28_04670 [Candidatus Dependentiae bacterium]